MTRVPDITYPFVSDICHELLANGERPTIRKLRDRIGGSFSTISVFLQQWQAEQTLAHKIDMDLSDAFRQSLLAEFTRISEASKKNLQAQLENEKTQLQETQALLVECEVNLEQVKHDFLTHQATSAEKQLALEKELIAANALLNEAAKRELSLQKTIEALRDRVHAAELKTAISATRCQEMEKQNHKFEQKNQALKREQVRSK